MTPSDIVITLAGNEIQNRVVYAESWFSSQANPVQGQFHLVVRDLVQNFDPTIGQRLEVTLDGVPLFGGYLFRIGRSNFFPAADTSDPGSMRSRKWILDGPDFNVLFDKRVLYDASNPVSALVVPSGRRTIGKAFTYLMQNFVDVPSGMDFTTYSDNITTQYGTEENGGLYVGQGKTWREQMDDFADQGGVIYYIDGSFNVHLHEYETVVMPWVFTDKSPNGTTTVGFREGEYTKDGNRIVTDALVWGGSAIRAPGGPEGEIVFARYPDPPANTATWHGRTQPAAREQDAIDRQGLYGRWQYGEEHAGQDNYLTLGSVKNRAFVIINGPPGAVPNDGIEGGFNRPEETMKLVWFAHDVPSGIHVRPGYISTFILYTQGQGGSPLVVTLPCRSIRVSFPTLPTGNTGGQTYVRFEGEFGTSYSDSRFLWKFLKRQRQALTPTTTVVDNFSDSAPPGSLATVFPNESANGTRTTFTYPYTFYRNQFSLYLNSLYQRAGLDYTYDATTGTVTFQAAPDTGDQQWAVGYVSE
jgi:hypothetical protein